MIILTNCLTEIVDEGGAKVVNSLIRRIKAADASVTVVSTVATDSACDVQIPSNKMLMNMQLIRFLWQSRQPVLYMPSYARSLFSSVRVYLLSIFTRRRLSVLLYMHSPIGRIAKLFFRLSGATLIALSAESYEEFRNVTGARSLYLRTGVDTHRFSPVSAAEKTALREKYCLPADKRIVLHVGHMTEGRNIRHMTKLDERYHGVLVVSTSDMSEEDKALRSALETRANITVIDRYIPAVEEIYQLADVYLFPVIEERHCIDVPVSVLEAAACGLPVVSTSYGEMKALLGNSGFYQITSFAPKSLNALLMRAIEEGENPRQSVLPYEWRHAVDKLLQSSD